MVVSFIRSVYQRISWSCMLSELLQNLLMLPKFSYLAWLPATIVTHPVEYGRKHQMQLQQGTDPCCGGAWLACSSIKQRTEKLLMTRKKKKIFALVYSYSIIGVTGNLKKSNNLKRHSTHPVYFIHGWQISGVLLPPSGLECAWVIIVPKIW